MADSECVWVIWAFRPERFELVAITTTEEWRDHYAEEAATLHEGAVIHVEQARLNHLYGAGMLAELNKVRHGR